MTRRVIVREVRKEPAKLGIKTDGQYTGTLAEIVAQVWHVQPIQGQRAQDYLGCWLDSLKPQNRSIAGPPYRPPFREYKPPRHLREAEIDAQPKRIPIGWDGTGVYW